MSLVRILVPCAVMSCLGVPILRAELRLVAKHGDHAIAVTGVENNHAVVLEGEQKIVLPGTAEFELEGDLKSNASLVLWEPRYGLRGGSPTKASVNITHETEWAGEKKESEFLRYWPVGVSQNALVLLGWMVEGKLTQLVVEAVPATAKSTHFQLFTAFTLSHREESGQAVALLWVDGKIVAPRPNFSEPKAQEAMIAIVRGDSAALRALLDTGANAAAVDFSKKSLLFYAAGAGNLDAVNALLEHGAKESATDAYGSTPLHWAARNGRQSVVERLLAANASLRKADSYGQTALHYALQEEHYAIARLLVEKGADAKAENQSHEYGLGMAINDGEVGLVELMLAHGAHIDFSTELMRGALATQIAKGHNDMVRFLIQHQVDPRPRQRGRGALAVAAVKGNRELAEFLVAAGVSVDETEAEGRTPLMVAVTAGNTDFAQALLDAGAQIGRRSNDGRTALHYAALRDTPALNQLLIEKSADIQVADHAHFAPLDYALALGAKNLADALAAHGARINLKSADASTQLETALTLDVSGLIQGALTDGWSPDAKLRETWPAILIAKTCKAPDSAALLEKAGAKSTGDDWPVVALARELDAKPRLISAVPPEDPRDVYADFPMTSVNVELIVDTEGKVLFPKVSGKENPGLTIATLSAVRQWRFAPGTRSGQPVCVRLKIPVTFPASAERALEGALVDNLPQLVKVENPVYPQQLSKSGQVGRVVMRFVVGKDGKVKDATVIRSSNPGFEQPALEAIRMWMFKPGLLDGRPVMVRAVQEIVFSLD